MRRIVVFRAGWSEKAEYAASGNLQVDAFDNRGDAVIALDDSLQFDASIRDRKYASHS